MKASFRQTVEIRAEIQRVVHSKLPTYVAIPRIHLVHRVSRKCLCSGYAVRKQIESLAAAKYLFYEKRGNRVMLFKTQKE